MLQWNSEVWGKLTGPYGSAEDMPALLERLMRQYSQEVFDELFQEYLFHQNTIYTATYAAMPFLAQLAESTAELGVRKELFINCGVIEASRDERSERAFLEVWAEIAEAAGSSVCAELFREYIEAVEKLKALTPEVFAYAAEHVADMTEKRYILVADAAYRGADIVANMLLTFIIGDEYTAVCPACQEDVFIWPDAENSAGTLQVYGQDPVFHEDQEAYAIVPAAAFADEEARILAERAAAIGERELAGHLPYLAGTASCPHCGQEMALWPALLSTFAR